MGNNDLCFTKWPVLKKNYIYYIYISYSVLRNSHILLSFFFIYIFFLNSFLEIYFLQNDNSTC